LKKTHLERVYLIIYFSGAKMKKDEDRTKEELFEEVRSLRKEIKNLNFFRDSEYRYRMIVENIFDVAYVYRPDGIVTFVTSNVFSLTGYLPDEIMGHNLIEFIYPDDIEFALSQIDKTINSGEIFPTCCRLLTKSGEIIYIEEIAKPLLDNRGNISQFIGIIRNITDRRQAEEALKKSEQLFRSYFELPLTGIAIVSSDKKWVEVNDKLCDILGYTRGELLNLTWTDITPQEDLSLELADYEKVFSGGLKINNLEKRYIRKDGTIIYVKLSSTCVRKPDNSVDYFVALIEDITGRKLIEQELIKNRTYLEERVIERTEELNLINKRLQKEIDERKKAEEKIKASLQEKEILLKEIHHRVKNNLQIISSLLYLQSDSIQDKIALDKFKESQNQIRSIALVHEKIYQSIDLSMIDFAEYIRRLSSYLFYTYNVNPMFIRLKIKAGNVYLPVDKAIPCALIVNELITNSLKHAFLYGNKGIIYIKFYIKDKKYILQFRDNGIGLPEEFDINNVNTIGLDLIINLAEQIDGFLEIDKNKGTSFKITFPV
jgi:PAS domain S-box-containing protein